MSGLPLTVDPRRLRMLVAGGGEAAARDAKRAVAAGGVVTAAPAGDIEPLAKRMRHRVGEHVGFQYGRALEGLMPLRSDLLARGDDGRWRDALESLLDEDTCVAIARGLFPRRLSAWH